MTNARWDRKTVPDSWGKPMSLWYWKDAGFTISQNIAVYEDGELLRWDYEICKIIDGEERYVAEARSLDAAKRRAKELHEESKEG
jgi:hypothetical protein